MTTHTPSAHHIQSRWTSVIRDTVLRDAKLLKILPESETSTAKLPEHIHGTVGPLCKQLLEHACEAQIAAPKASTARIERHIAAQIWNALKVFSPVKLGAHQQLEFDPYLTPESTSQWADRLQTSAQPEHEDSRS